MVHVHHEGTCHAPLEVTFAVIDDYRTAPHWMFGLSEFVPEGAQDQGLGAVFNGTFHVKPVKLHSTVEIVGWEHNQMIALKSIKGFPNESVWHMSAVDDKTTKLTVDFSYELPGGLAGKALGRALEPIVAMSVRHTDHALTKYVEEQYQARG
jgi:uncharacterized membrane protein